MALLFSITPPLRVHLTPLLTLKTSHPLLRAQYTTCCSTALLPTPREPWSRMGLGALRVKANSRALLSDSIAVSVSTL